MSLLRRDGSRRLGSAALLPALTSAVLGAAVLTGCTSTGSDPVPSPPGPAGTPSLAATVPGSTSPGSRGDAPAGSGSPAAPVAPGSVSADPAKDPAFAAFYGQKPAWSGCGDGLDCTKVTVPVDWAAPSGATFQLAVIRHRATGKKIGSLFTNPGGPGVSGVKDLKERVVPEFGPALQSAFDLVSWDPRGIGGSSPVSCLPNSALDHFFSEDATPDTPAEVSQFVEDQKAFAAACQANTGPLLRHIDTISTAKDMDVLRAIVGDDVFSYVGASNGTFLGAWYAQLFPWRVGRMVLDGVVDPSLTGAQLAEGQAMGFARALQSYVDDCLKNRGCPLKGTRADAYAQLAQLLDRADSAPLRTSGVRPLTQALMTTGITYGLYSQQLWPALSKGLTEAFRGDGTTLLLLADLYAERDKQGTYDLLLQAYYAIDCLDHAETRSLDAIAADSARLRAKYPPFGDTLGWGQVVCDVWPYPAVVPAERITANGAKPILVVGTTDDPATPYEWATSLASQLSSGRLLTRKGQGHTAYQAGSACTDAALAHYLVSGTLPAAGTVCS